MSWCIALKGIIMNSLNCCIGLMVQFWFGEICVYPFVYTAYLTRMFYFGPCVHWNIERDMLFHTIQSISHGSVYFKRVYTVRGLFLVVKGTLGKVYMPYCTMTSVDICCQTCICPSFIEFFPLYCHDDRFSVLLFLKICFLFMKISDAFCLPLRYGLSSISIEIMNGSQLFSVMAIFSSL